jgi:hypothetical protein
MYFEVALGLPQDGGASALDSPEPLAVRLPGGKVIRLHGRIDRVDQIAGHKFGIIDYKTGGSYGFEPKDPFRQGRHVQNVLYLVMMQQRLQEAVAKDAVVAQFGYFFPNHKELGKRVEWEAADLQGGLPVVELLVDMLARGCFPLSNDFAKDLEFPNDYSSAFGDARAGAQAITAKMANPQNKALVPFISLRNGDKGEELPAGTVSPKAHEARQDNQSGTKGRRVAR